MAALLKNNDRLINIFSLEYTIIKKTEDQIKIVFIKVINDFLNNFF